MKFTISKIYDGWSLRKWSRYHLPNLSYLTLSTLARKKLIRINNRTSNLATILSTEDEIFVSDSLTIQANEKIVSTELIKNMLLFENNNYFVVEKPNHMLSQGGLGSIAELTNGYIVHRLDKTTSGVMIVSKTKEYANYLSEQIRNHQFKKTYVAVCERKNQIPQTGIFTSEIDEKFAETEYRILEIFRDKILIELTLLTGRKHQIRIHCAQHDIPILGDIRYSGSPADRIYLHSQTITFKDGTTTVTFSSKKNFDLHHLAKNSTVRLNK